ncbi:calcium-binding protein [Mycobacterium sp. KBS0706]|uniref:calcium-binding protein n=1 Tax=Mycobacterium sp. KBS0706 TaxID=2578109 RepID=UPI00110F7A41|nr:calcium-binding protein [Mycobacterium sp. KBS0706]TSD85153.1 calcium-binding protein [Mycobacterium sp. KBS0706]
MGDPTPGDDVLTGTPEDDFLEGLAGNDQIFGLAGDDTLLGGPGADRLDGGAGIDTAAYDVSRIGVNVDLATGVCSGDATGDQLAGIENLRGSNYKDQLGAAAAGSLLDGGNGDDYLYGNAGDDRLIGGGGYDRLYGSSGDDTLYGSQGGDLMHGGGGFDTVSYAASWHNVAIDLSTGDALYGDAEFDTLVSIEGVIGSAYNDELSGGAVAERFQGGAGNDKLFGRAGDDVLNGGAGADALNGGAGLDFADYQGSLAAVTVDLLTHSGSGGDAQGDTLVSIENLAGSANSDHLIGDDLRNVFAGRADDDLLAGNGGNDALSGEAGNDTLHGDAGDDTLEGGAGADTLTGGAGADVASYAGSLAGVMVSLAGNTGEGGDAAGDALLGIESLVGSGAGDTLIGDAGANGLSGGGGNDVLSGGTGADVLKGGAGTDRFVYAAIGDSTVGAAGRDIIADFAVGDRIDLSAIDADGAAGGGNTEFVFGTGAFTGHPGEVRVVNYGGGRQGVYLEVNGDTTVDAIIEVYAAHGLTAEDFVL